MNRKNALSLAMTVGLGLVILVSLGQATITPTPLLRFEYVPHPRDMIQIKEGTPYTVPADKIFVVTAMGGNRDVFGDNQFSLQVNGQPELEYGSGSSGGDPVPATSVQPVAQGFTVAAGSVIAVVGADLSSPDGRVWGYLADD